jgi:hypothetical protein
MMNSFLTRTLAAALIASAISFASFSPAEALQSIGSVEVTALGANSARVDISLSGFSTAPADYRYEICWRKVNQIMFICWANEALTNDAAQIIYGLSANTTYRMRVRCYCRKTAGPWPAIWREVKDEFDYTFAPPPPPPPPTPPPATAYYRLRNVQSGQCLFVETSSSRVRNWGCWNDPGMRFALLTFQDGHKQLRHANSGLCVWGMFASSSSVFATGCGATGTNVVLTQQSPGVFSIGIDAMVFGMATSGRCLNIGSPNGGDIWKSACNGTPLQRFSLDPA